MTLKQRFGESVVDLSLDLFLLHRKFLITGTIANPQNVDKNNI